MFETCDFCKKAAVYDAKTIHGPWAYMCTECFKKHGCGLGRGLGQILVKEDYQDMRNIEAKEQAKRLDLKICFASELFSKLSASNQDKITGIAKQMLSGE